MQPKDISVLTNLFTQSVSQVSSSTEEKPEHSISGGTISSR